ncbi:hypothetical protein LEP1GSC049_2564 [Leptospira kirschneri serovar Cynopteri str. 3522 CT]|nr:hypothetical protein LEP1GSC064_0444 [Leptospira kirschneri serovar Grippotyphosa str. Moskva]EKR10082.1 hypothetical protein LEP1GSC122_3469 [Leptospira kirschneri serovar Valbuzzi str. 200702274]EMN04529.1 hypothetical protein LEP1GSC046_4131 [Leptospira kirschneri serovar Bim str. 1051]EMN27228.1 hypothetical protein LEP1GSC065_3735 [Leptospira kirschneri serovar Sokoine str. RM1]EPG51326.1 hypothetical protein LEP1GSC049_2564 [Leptospira kirschneri serovar Cynopteri str. 3522 CT]
MLFHVETVFEDKNSRTQLEQSDKHSNFLKNMSFDVRKNFLKV